MAILVPFSSALLTQEASKASAITLHVVDEAGGNVPSADVQLVPFPTSLSEGLTTDHDGNLLVELPPGHYDVTVRAPAFFPEAKLIEVELESRQTIQIVLKAKSCSPGPCLPVTSKAQGTNCVTVRVLHEKNAKPIKGVQVRMSLAYFDNSARKYASVDIGKTDKQGITRYCFNDHLPESFSVNFYEFSGPDEGELFKPEDVLRHGAVVVNNRAKSKSVPDVRPGEVIALGERWWLVDRWIGPWP